MKTSYVLLAITAFVTLSGMIATNVLLKQEYNKIDWRNPYQDFEIQNLPKAKHWVIEGMPTHEIMLMQSIDKAEALVTPGLVNSFRSWQQGDTVFVSFTPDNGGYQNEPRNDADHELRVQLVLRIPKPQSLQVKKARLTLSELRMDSLMIALENSRLRTNKLAILNTFDLKISANSFAALGSDSYKSLSTVVQDSSGMQLKNTQIEAFTKEIAPKAEIQVSGQALQWLK